jgi:hypothetical protein
MASSWQPVYEEHARTRSVCQQINERTGPVVKTTRFEKREKEVKNV